ncbi:MAG TPA: NADH-quinone oxidoreductase subunit C [Actinomycetota bacterium]|nr:NADH-quinone oxidoreductase subunit C [Actinomycetota bacterium]
MNETLTELCAGLRESFPEHVGEPVVEFGETSVRVARERVLDVCRWLRDNGPFELLADLSGVDYLGIAPDEDRFMVAYHLYSFRRNERLRLRAFVPDGDERIESVATVWPSANWMEREVYDFFGIVFEGHPDLRRILMPDDWDGYPQRKDYPLGGTKVEFKGVMVPPPNVRRQPSSTTTGYPGRIS